MQVPRGSTPDPTFFLIHLSNLSPIIYLWLQSYIFCADTNITSRSETDYFQNFLNYVLASLNNGLKATKLTLNPYMTNFMKSATKNL
jgi:hypothetical protein